MRNRNGRFGHTSRHMQLLLDSFRTTFDPSDINDKPQPDWDDEEQNHQFKVLGRWQDRRYNF